MDKGLLQKEAAMRLHVSEDCVTYWEKGRSIPQIRNYPWIIEFLGYYPFEHETATLAGKLRHLRSCKGLSFRQCAKLLNVDGDTVQRWERGESIRNETCKRLIHSIWSELPHHHVQHPK